MKWLLLLATVIASAQQFEVTPASARQGDVFRLHASSTATQARMGERTVRLFPAAGASEGLMPVYALEKPGAFTIEFLDASGNVLASRPVTVTDAHFLKQNVVLGREVAELKPSPGEMEGSDAFRKLVTGERFWAEPFAVPVPGCRTSPYGSQRLHNGKPTGNYHAGLDQRGAAGTPVHAISAGQVRLAKEWAIHGNTIGVDHGQGVASMYMHLSKFAVAEGAHVERGQVIGYIGTTGRSTAPHLHWSLYVNGVPVNPSRWVEVRPCAVARPAARPAAKKVSK